MLPTTASHKTGILDFEVHHCRNLSTETQNTLVHGLRIISVMIKRHNSEMYICSINLDNFHTKFIVDHIFNRSATWDLNASKGKVVPLQAWTGLEGG
jgi:hypothetical protein